jgi:type IV secretion system protein VirB1
MLPGIEMMACQDMAVPMDVMKHVVHVESSNNPFAIGVVGGRLVRQPTALDEALATARMLEEKGYNFSVGLAQVNRYNLSKYGLDSYEQAFKACPNLQAGSKILAECFSRSGNDWGKSFSCYYSGNFVTGYRHGYVQKVYASIENEQRAAQVAPIALVGGIPRARSVAQSGANPAAKRIVAERSPEAAAAERVAERVVPSRVSASDVLRADVVGAIDTALVQAVVGRRERAVRPLQAQESAERGTSPPVAPVAAIDAGAKEAPVMLRAWNERNAPATVPVASQQAVAASAPGDAAFVF